MKNLKYVKSPKKIGNTLVVNDIEDAIECLSKGITVARFEYGDSMSPLLESGEYCIIEPIDDINKVEIGDAVLCEVNGYAMTHMVMMKSNVKENNPYFLIGSSSLFPYGWTNKIYGKCKGTNVIEMPQTFDSIEEV